VAISLEEASEWVRQQMSLLPRERQVEIIAVCWAAVIDSEWADLNGTPR
jgi:hypothetical protein